MLHRDPTTFPAALRDVAEQLDEVDLEEAEKTAAAGVELAQAAGFDAAPLRHGKALAKRPLCVFSSGPCGEKSDPAWAELPRVIQRAERLGVRDHVVFGGRLPLEPSNFMERAMVDNCPPDKRDLRDWDAIRAWATETGSALSSATGHPAESKSED